MVICISFLPILKFWELGGQAIHGDLHIHFSRPVSFGNSGLGVFMVICISILEFWDFGDQVGQNEYTLKGDPHNRLK